MPLLSSAIVAMCLNYQGQYKEACVKALESATRQTGVYQSIEQTENQVNRYANNRAEHIVGRKGISIVGTGFFVVRTVRDKTVTFFLPNFGICNSIGNRISPTSYDMDIEWKF